MKDYAHIQKMKEVANKLAVNYGFVDFNSAPAKYKQLILRSILKPKKKSIWQRIFGK